MDSRHPLLVVAGPTASGKTALAVELARRLNGEIISGDSMQVYAPLQIGTARPTEEEMGGIPHHLLGFLPLDAAYSVAQYTADAHAAIAAVEGRGHLPILCGGTGLYIQAVTEDLTFPEQAGDPALRARLKERALDEGGSVLLEELRGIDPDTAARLHPNDIGRIVRALEVYEETGEPMSRRDRRGRQRPDRYEAVYIGLSFRDREDLRERIDRRVDEMVRRGLLQEVQALLDGGLPRDATALQAIGYKQFLAVADGTATAEQAVEEGKLRSRQYAKRQLTWLRRNPAIHWIYWDKEPDFPAALQNATDFLTAHGLG